MDSDPSDDVWTSPDKIFERNHVEHVTRRVVTLGEHVRRVGLVTSVAMASHKPLPENSWTEAESLKTEVAPLPGAITSWSAASASSERPERLLESLDELRNSGLAHRCISISARPATIEEIQEAHDAAHVERLLRLEEEASPEAILKVSMSFNYVFMNQQSVKSARLASGAVVTAVEEVMRGNLDSAVAVVRPPGHHAECSCGMGFGIFNNVAIAARSAVNRLGLQRILIVDWDVHHGNGTQQIFESDSDVLFFSVHRYDFGIFYPGAYYQAINQDVPGRPDFVGVEPAKGFTVNLGWDCLSTGESLGDAEYVAAWSRLLMPIAREFNPELVIVSAGFDSAKGDPEGELGCTPAGYAHMTHELMQLANGRVVVVLEGGYNVASVKYCLGACVGTLLGAEPPDPASFGTAKEAALNAIRETITAHQPYWASLS